jgi:cysteine-rich repeat protein
MCTREIGWSCTAVACATSQCAFAVCGDGRSFDIELESDNFCDDGNTVSGDGCSSSCEIECGFTCTQDEPSHQATCVQFCGDGKIGPDEGCDDLNWSDGDGCSSM